MANWCSTRIWFYSENHDTIEDFHDYVNECMSDETKTYKKTYLGNILSGVGVEDRGQIVPSNGDILHISEIETFDGCRYFYVDTETAWLPMIRIWDEVLRALDIRDEIDISYQAEEAGNDLFAYHDDFGFVTDMVYIDSYTEEVQGYYSSVDEAYEAVKRFFEIPSATQEYVDEIVEQFNEEQEGNDFIYIHIFREAGLLEYF